MTRISDEDLQKLLRQVSSSRETGTEDHWWHSRICDFYLEEDFDAYDDQKGADKKRILRVPALERATEALAAEVLALRKRVAAADALAKAAWEHDEAFCVLEDSFQIAAREKLEAALAAYEASK